MLNPFVLRAGSCLLAAVLQPMSHAETVTLTLGDGQPGRAFEGIGCLSAGASSRLLIDYPEPQRGEILDDLFKPNQGAAFQHLKVEIGGDVNSTDGCEPSHMRSPQDENYRRGYEWWLMKEAKRRNPAILLDCLEWGAPGWIGNGNFNSQDNADYIASFILGARRAHGLQIDYTGAWNETRADVGFIKRLRQTLDRRGLGRVAIVAMDEINRWQLVELMKTDPELARSVQVVGVHYPKFRSTPAATECGKPIWSSEDGPWKGNWAGAAALARIYNRNYIEGRMTKTIVWSPVTAYYSNLPLPGSGVMRANEPWTGHYEIQPALWATAHTTQFAAPGWRYLDPGCGLLPAGGSIVTLAAPNGTDYSLIAETTDAGRSIDVEVRLSALLTRSPVHVWRSDAGRQFVRLPEVTPADGTWRLTLDPGCIYSCTTTTGQGQAPSNPPPSRPWPSRYAEDFERCEPGTSPRFFMDQAGIFEVGRKAKGTGRALQQILTQKGIEWPFHLNPAPETFLGSTTWRDYEVSVNAYLEEEGHVSLFGRVGRVPQNAHPPEAYCLQVDQDGYWELGTATMALRSGRVPFALRQWHALALRFAGDEIRVSIDGREVGRLQDRTYAEGMAGLGCGWHRAQFDDLSIDVAPGDVNLALGGVARASSSLDVDAQPANATDGDPFTTRWSAASGRMSEEWLEVDLGRVATFDSVLFRPFEERILGYKVQYFDAADSTWRDAAAGFSPGPVRIEQFGPVQARRVRLLVTEARDTPGVWEFEVRNTSRAGG